ncbi:MAG TPA: glycine cleavage T C-terminal barrel domain-containing protein [Vicinamibacteria bacterium]|nr:glycine cleavage T C-terminal barrel domain-containing protein [Vicinamibacteria bacterium]
MPSPPDLLLQDVAGEYAAAREGAALVDLPLRSLLEASGPARQKLLQGMLSNDVAGRAPGQGCRAALLNAKGAVQALLRVLVEKDVIVLETDLDRVGPVQQVLEHHRVAAPVRFAARPTRVLALLGPGAEPLLSAVGIDSSPASPEAHQVVAIAGHSLRLVRAGDLPGGGFVLHAAPETSTAVWEALRAAGARPVGRDALDALRVEALRPWYGSDVTAENLLHETGLVAECHSPAKGCYVGQEVVARLEARGGHVNKALRGLRLSAPATAGAAVTAEGREIGRVTTAAVSPRLGPIALAYVHRDHFASGTAVQVDGAPATVVTSFGEPSEKGAAEPARE